MNFLNNFPTVGARVFVTLLAVIATAIALLAFDRAVTDAWLTFLAVMSGIDGAAVIGKRLSAKPDVINAESDAVVRKINATAAAVPPLTPKEAKTAGEIHTDTEPPAATISPVPKRYLNEERD